MNYPGKLAKAVDSVLHAHVILFPARVPQPLAQPKTDTYSWLNRSMSSRGPEVTQNAKLLLSRTPLRWL